MGTSSILGGERAAAIPAGKDMDALGPSDSSDSGSDMAGVYASGSDSDAAGTGERGSAVPQTESDRPGSDIAPDRVVSDPDGGVTRRRRRGRRAEEPAAPAVEELAMDDGADEPGLEQEGPDGTGPAGAREPTSDR